MFKRSTKQLLLILSVIFGILFVIASITVIFTDISPVKLITVPCLLFLISVSLYRKVK